MAGPNLLRCQKGQASFSVPGRQRRSYATHLARVVSKLELVLLDATADGNDNAGNGNDCGRYVNESDNCHE